ncbi:MAG: 2-oxo-4-hydroxy-4-carboxy-5-ureidoimidazoline decarboxylase [Thermoanaerobaculia bacterium]
MTGLDRFNALPRNEAERLLAGFCASPVWAERVARLRPFDTAGDAIRSAEEVWSRLSPGDWLEAFAAHPRIGDRASGVAAGEQSGIRGAPAEILAELAEANREYEDRFGHVFLVCATGKSAEEMLAICRSRLHNDAPTELRNAAEEQRKITRIRMEKFFDA